MKRYTVIPVLACLAVLLPMQAVAQGLDSLPSDVRERVDEVEAARETWESRQAEVISQLEVQPWEEEDEFSRRVERAVERGAGRELRFLQFQLNELRQNVFRIASERITLSPDGATGGDRPGREQSWPVEVRAEPVFLTDADRFTVRVPPDERDGVRAGHFELARAIEDGELQGRITYRLSGHADGRYRITMEQLHLFDGARPGPAFASVPVNRHYEFSRYEPMTVVQPGVYFTFSRGTIPEGFAMAGDAPWRIVADHPHAGDFALRAGTIDHGQYSEVSYEIAVPAGAAVAKVSFVVRTSSETRYDFLGFYLDGDRLDTWSGMSDWIPASWDVEVEGMTGLELRWRYEKDGSVSEGEDTAWIDDVRVEFE